MAGEVRECQLARQFNLMQLPQHAWHLGSVQHAWYLDAVRCKVPEGANEWISLMYKHICVIL